MTFHCRYERAGAFTYPIDNATTLSITRLGRTDIARKYDAVCALPMCSIHKLERRVQREGQPPICVFCQWEEDGGVITVVGDQWAGGIVDKKKPAPKKGLKKRARKIDRVCKAAAEDKLQQTLLAFKGFTIS